MSIVICDDGYPEEATICESCNQRAVIRMDGMNTCLACGHSEEPCDPSS